MDEHFLLSLHLTTYQAVTESQANFLNGVAADPPWSPSVSISLNPVCALKGVFVSSLALRANETSITTSLSRSDFMHHI